MKYEERNMKNLQKILKEQEQEKEVERKCEWEPCNEKAVCGGASGDGRFVFVCLIHKKALRKYVASLRD